MYLHVKWFDSFDDKLFCDSFIYARKSLKILTNIFKKIFMFYKDKSDTSIVTCINTFHSFSLYDR